MQLLRQSTSVVVRIGPAVAVGDGFTPVTGLTVSGADEAEALRAAGAATLDISGATFAAITGADGWYSLTLDTTATNTVGTLDIVINDDSLVLPIFARFQVVEEAVYDQLLAASAPGAASASKATQIYSDSTKIESKVTQIYSDTTAINTQTGTASSKAVQIYSDTTIVTSKTTQIYSDTTLIEASRAVIAEGTAQAATGTTLQLASATAFSGNSDPVGATIVITGGSAGVGQSRTILSYVTATDTATVDTWSTTPTGTITYKVFATPPQTAANDSKLTKVSSKATQIYSDTTIVTSKTTQIYSDTTLIQTQTVVAGSKAVQIYSDTTIVTSKATQIYSDTAIVVGSVGAQFQKNVAASDIPFVLVDSTDHVTREPLITVTVTRSIDGGAFASATGTVTEVGNGVYSFDASQADMNGNNIVLRFTGTGCDPVELHIKTYT